MKRCKCGSWFWPEHAFHVRCGQCFRAGSRRPPAPAVINDALIKRIVRLTHPDKHPPERAREATSVTAELLEIRAQLGQVA